MHVPATPNVKQTKIPLKHLGLLAHHLMLPCFQIPHELRARQQSERKITLFNRLIGSGGQEETHIFGLATRALTTIHHTIFHHREESAIAESFLVVTTATGNNRFHVREYMENEQPPHIWNRFGRSAAINQIRAAVIREQIIMSRREDARVAQTIIKGFFAEKNKE